MYLIFTASVAAAGGLALDRLRVPAGALVGALIAVAAVNIVTGRVVAVPHSAEIAILVAVGWLIGLGLSVESFRALRGAAGPVIVLVVALVAVGALLGVLFSKIGWFDPLTGYLASSPGGLQGMSALATTLGGDATVVLAVHTLRIVTVQVVSPFIARMLA